MIKKKRPVYKSNLFMVKNLDKVKSHMEYKAL